LSIWKGGDFECAITLADEAEGTFAGADEVHFLQILKEISRFHKVGAAAGRTEG
jgi:hypothetical protein